MNMTEKQNLIREELNQKIIQQLESGKLPWQRPWEKMGACKNAFNGHVYRGINVLLTEIHRLQYGLTSNLFATLNQANQAKCKVKKGSQGCKLVFFSPRIVTKTNKKTGEEETYSFPVLKYFWFYNLDQLEGEKVDKVKAEQEEALKIRQAAPRVYDKGEKIINLSGANIVYGGDDAHYVPATDRISLPEKNHFLSPEGFYLTAFHELAHWTGVESRCNRIKKWTRFGSEAYAIEELVAEISSCYTATATDIEMKDLKNNAAYIQDWLKKLKNDNRLIFQASSAAAQASDFLLKKAGLLAEPDKAPKEIEV